MKAEVLLKAALMVLILALAVVITSWLASEGAVAQAQGGGGSASGQWVLVTSTIQTGESVLYMFNAEKEVLLVYAYYRRSGTSAGASRYRGDLEFLAGRHCKWDALYSQRRPYPYGIKKQEPPSGTHTPAEMKKYFDKVSQE
ncbi:MAG: hypothetical protein ABIF82_04235 [Planctomycetota bacterium]